MDWDEKDERISRHIAAAHALRAVALEREACAKVAGGHHDHVECGHGEGYMDGRRDAAAAIRAR